MKRRAWTPPRTVCAPAPPAATLRTTHFAAARRRLNVAPYATMQSEIGLNRVGHLRPCMGGMLPQSQIQRPLGGAASVDRIVEILATEEFASRGAPGRWNCEEFGFADARGQWHRASEIRPPARDPGRLAEHTWLVHRLRHERCEQGPVAVTTTTLIPKIEPELKAEAFRATRETR